MEKCMVCDLRKLDGNYTCKMCGMKFDDGIEFEGTMFCSDACRNFFIGIRAKSPRLAGRDIVI